MMPSRDFLIGQAVLNAVAEMLPTTLQMNGTAHTVKWAGDHVPETLCEITRRHFRILEARYHG